MCVVIVPPTKIIHSNLLLQLRKGQGEALSANIGGAIHDKPVQLFPIWHQNSATKPFSLHAHF